MYTTLLIDLDETVYSTSCGVWDAISARMERYMEERLGLARAEIPALRRQLYQAYGTTLRGLQVTRQVNEREFIDYVHDVPLDLLLQPDPALREILLRYAHLRRVIFTNADHKHAARVLERLNISPCFEMMVDIYDIAPYCKPMPEAYQVALEKIGVRSARECIFVDDSPRNLAAARALGFFTVQVGQPKPGLPHPTAGADAVIPRLHDLPVVLDPLLFGTSPAPST